MTDDNLDIENIIARYLASEASDEEQAMLLEWIRQSDDNRRQFFELRDVWHALHPSFTMEDSDTLSAEEKILAELGLRKKKKVWFRNLMKIWSRIAAVIVLPLLIFFVYKLAVSDNTKAPVQIQEISTTYGCSMKTTLPDGSTVWLNANSSLKYPAEFKADARDVDLKGEAYFEVQADKKHPFIVHTPDMNVMATGTQFNVNAPGVEYASSVTLVKGKVDVNVSDSQKKYEMQPGEHLKYAKGDVYIAKCDTNKYCSWRDGVLLFDDDSLRDICDRLEQIYNIKFTISDPQLAQTRYYMTLRGESINEIMHLLEMSAPVVCTTESAATSSAPMKIKIESTAN